MVISQFHSGTLKLYLTNQNLDRSLLQNEDSKLGVWKKRFDGQSSFSNSIGFLSIGYFHFMTEVQIFRLEQVHKVMSS
jgi:hypothetical protein